MLQLYYNNDMGVYFFKINFKKSIIDMIFDTGSSNIVIVENNCIGCNTNNNLNLNINDICTNDELKQQVKHGVSYIDGPSLGIIFCKEYGIRLARISTHPSPLSIFGAGYDVTNNVWPFNQLLFKTLNLPFSICIDFINNNMYASKKIELQSYNLIDKHKFKIGTKYRGYWYILLYNSLYIFETGCTYMLLLENYNHILPQWINKDHIINVSNNWLKTNYNKHIVGVIGNIAMKNNIFVFDISKEYYGNISVYKN